MTLILLLDDLLGPLMTLIGLLKLYLKIILIPIIHLLALELLLLQLGLHLQLLNLHGLLLKRILTVFLVLVLQALILINRILGSLARSHHSVVHGCCGVGVTSAESHEDYQPEYPP